MTAPIHIIPIDAGDAGETLKRFLSGSLAEAHRKGLVIDRCSPAGLLARTVEIYGDGRVVLVP